MTASALGSVGVVAVVIGLPSGTVAVAAAVAGGGRALPRVWSGRQAGGRSQ